MKILLIDNLAFAGNLQILIQEAMPDVELDMVRNDEPIMAIIKENKYDGIVIGPGPGSAEDKAYFGENMRVILEAGTSGTPVLGIGLGFQAIFKAFGGTLTMLKLPMHGKVSALNILEPGVLLQGVRDGTLVMRAHSIAADFDTVPDSIKVTALAVNTAMPNEVNGKEIMAIEHVEHPIFGLQFQPESFGTQFAHQMMRNFLDHCHACTVAA